MQPQSLFTNYIIAGAQALLARVQAAEYVVPDADRQQAWHLLSFALKVEEAWPVTRQLLLALAPKMELAGFRENWIPYLEKGLQCAHSMRDGQVVAECELQIGLLYRLLSRFEEAQYWTKASVNRLAASKDPQNHARSLNELAWLEHLQHHYEEATQHAEQALTLLNEQNLEQVMSYRVLGMIALLCDHDLPTAEQYHRKSLMIFEQFRDRRRAAWSLQNLALALCWQKKFHEAFTYYHKASEALEALGDMSHWAIVQMNLGSAYYQSGDSESAIACLHRAERVMLRLHNQLEMAKINTHLGLVYLSLKRYPESEDTFRAAIDLYRALGDRGWQLNAMDGLAMTFLAIERPAEAISIVQQALAMLPQISHMPNYGYLRDSLTKHLHEAQQQMRDTNAKTPLHPLTSVNSDANG